MPRMTLKLLGQSIIEIEGHECKFRQKRSAALLIYCALEGRTIGRDELCDLLWPDSNPVTSRRRLSDALSSLRADLPHVQVDDYLVVTPETIQITPVCECNCDLFAFVSGIQEIESHTITIERLEQIDKLYGGVFLANFRMRGGNAESGSWEDWLREKQSTLAEQHLALQRRLAMAYCHSGKYQSAIALLSKLVVQDGETQSLYALLMLCHYAQNQRHIVQRVYEQYETMMQNAFGADSPEAFMQHLWREVQSNSPSQMSPYQLMVKVLQAPISFEDTNLEKQLGLFIQQFKHGASKNLTANPMYRKVERRLKQYQGMVGTTHLFLVLCEEDSAYAQHLFDSETLQRIVKLLQEKLHSTEALSDNSNAVYTLALHNVLERAKNLIEADYEAGNETIRLWQALLKFEDTLPVQMLESRQIDLTRLLERLNQQIN